MPPVVIGLGRLILSVTLGFQPAACCASICVCGCVYTPECRFRSSPESHLKLCTSKISAPGKAAVQSQQQQEILSNLVHATFMTLMAYHFDMPGLPSPLLTSAWGFVIRHYYCRSSSCSSARSSSCCYFWSCRLSLGLGKLAAIDLYFCTFLCRIWFLASSTSSAAIFSFTFYGHTGAALGRLSDSLVSQLVI